MNKHAYLIIAHNNFEILEKTLKILDDEKNDFYIHIDRKVKSFNFEKFKTITEKSKIIFTERINVKWGHSSQIDCELLLLKSAIKNNYSYYHLLSGVDMPIKSKEIIYNFFEKNLGKEFINFKDKKYNVENNDRFKLYHIFPYYPRSRYKYIIGVIEIFLIKLQKILNINRIENKNISFQKGANWFSITNNFVKYILSKEIWIKNTFKYTFCCDEIFLQTLLINSKFKKNLYNKKFDDDHTASIKRYIDWKRGNPYIFRKKDFKDLINSEALFARKFDLSTDKDIVEMIFKRIYKKSDL